MDSCFKLYCDISLMHLQPHKVNQPCLLTTITIRTTTILTPRATRMATTLAAAVPGRVTMGPATARAMPNTTRHAGANACLKPVACACWRCT